MRLGSESEILTIFFVVAIILFQMWYFLPISCITRHTGDEYDTKYNILLLHEEEGEENEEEIEEKGKEKEYHT